MKTSALNHRFARLTAGIFMCLIPLWNTLKAQQFFNESALTRESPEPYNIVEKDVVNWVRSEARKEAIAIASAIASSDPVILSVPVTSVNNDQNYTYHFNYNLSGIVQSVAVNIPDWLTMTGSKDGIVSTFAGSGQSGFTNATGLAAQFNQPFGIAADAAGNVYISDSANQVIRKISPEGVVTTFAGSGGAGFNDGTGSNASFNFPRGLAIDAQGNLYVADSGNHRIRKVTPAGVVTTVAGVYFQGNTNGSVGSASLSSPQNIAVSSSGDLYIVQSGGTIRKVSGGQVSTFATGFNSVSHVAIGPNGNIYVSDNNNHRIRKYTPAGAVSTFAGSGQQGFANGQGTSAKFHSPRAIAFDALGNLLVLDGANQRVRKVTPDGTVTTIAGSGATGSTDGPASTANFNWPDGIAVDPVTADIYLTNAFTTHSVRRISKNFTLTGAAAGHVGDHDIEITVTDTDGNTDTQNFTLEVADVAAPVLTSANSVNFQENTFGTVHTVTATDLEALTFSLGTSRDESHFIISESGVITFVDTPDFENPRDGNSDNIYEVEVRVNDGTFISTQIINITVTDEDLAPVITSGNSSSFAEDAGSFSHTVIAIDDEPITYSLGTNNDEALFDIAEGVISFNSDPDFENPLDGNGDNIYMVEVLVNDGKHTTSQTISLSISNVDEAPIFTTAPITSVNDQNSYTYVVAAKDPEGGNVVLSATTKPNWLSFDENTGTLSGTAPGYGSHNIVLTATDATGNQSTQTFTMENIDTVKPVFTSEETTATFQENATGTVYTNVATDAAPITYSLGPVNHGGGAISDFTLFDIADGIVTFKEVPDHETAKDYGKDNSYEITVSASDGTHTISRVVTITVANLNDNDPVFTATSSVSVNDNATLSVPIPTSDADGDPITVTASSLPAWLSLDAGDGVVSTLAGGEEGDSDGSGQDAEFDTPYSVALDAAGNVYVADQSNHKIRKITPTGVMTTFAGSKEEINNVVQGGDADGTGTEAKFNSPGALAIDAAGNVYVADTYNHKIRKITPAGVVSTIAGSSQGFADGTGASAQFDTPYGIAVDQAGNLYVGDLGNHKVRKITPAGVVSTLAGSAQGFADGTTAAAQFNAPTGVAVDALGNVFVADGGNHKIRKITPAGVVTTFAGSTPGLKDGEGAGAQFHMPWGLALDKDGFLFVADRSNHRVRKN